MLQHSEHITTLLVNSPSGILGYDQRPGKPQQIDLSGCVCCVQVSSTGGTNRPDRVPGNSRVLVSNSTASQAFVDNREEIRSPPNWLIKYSIACCLFILRNPTDAAIFRRQRLAVTAYPSSTGRLAKDLTSWTNAYLTDPLSRKYQ